MAQRFNFQVSVSKLLFSRTHFGTDIPQDFKIILTLRQPLFANTVNERCHSRSTSSSSSSSSRSAQSRKRHSSREKSKASPMKAAIISNTQSKELSEDNRMFESICKTLLTEEVLSDETFALHVRDGKFDPSEKPRFDITFGKAYPYTSFFEQRLLTISICTTTNKKRKVLAQTIIDLSYFSGEGLFTDIVPLYSPVLHKKEGEKKTTCVAVLSIQFDVIELNVSLQSLFHLSAIPSFSTVNPLLTQSSHSLRSSQPHPFFYQTRQSRKSNPSLPVWWTSSGTFSHPRTSEPSTPTQRNLRASLDQPPESKQAKEMEQK